MPGSTRGKRSNPPIKGHELLHEGRVSWPRVNHETGDYYLIGDPRRHTGGCRCGAKPEGWPSVSVNATKRWHREHKEAIRTAGHVDIRINLDAVTAGPVE